MSTLAEALAPKSDQLNADDLIPGPRVLKITAGKISSEERQKRIVLNFEGDQGKPWKPCKTMGRAMVMAWAITDPQQFAGKMVRVYRDPTVKFGDQGEVGGIRISHMSDIAKPVSMKLTVSQGKKALFTFHPLVAEAPAGDEMSLALAEKALRSAATLDDLRTAWSRKSMAPHRAALQGVLDECKGLLSLEPADTLTENPTAEEGRATEDRGEGFTDDAFAGGG